MPQSMESIQAGQEEVRPFFCKVLPLNPLFCALQPGSPALIVSHLQNGLLAPLGDGTSADHDGATAAWCAASACQRATNDALHCACKHCPTPCDNRCNAC